MKIKIIPYEPCHALVIIEERIRKHDLWLLGVEGAETIPYMWAKHPASTLLVDGEVIICGGIILMGYQRGEVWALFADNFKQYPIAVFKACRFVTETIAAEHNLRRLQTLVEPALNGGRAFVERLGFKEESLLECYGPNGEDLLMFVKINRELQ